MMKKFFERYETPAVEWLLSPDAVGGGILCQSPTGGLDDIAIDREEGEDDGWLN